MTLLTPAAVAFLALVPVIVAFHFLRIRRREVTLGSNFLWQQAVRERMVRRPWRRFRVSLLLILQVLSAVLITFALMRPATATTTNLTRNTVLVLEASASMQDTDVSPSRFDVARRRVDDIAASLGSDDRIVLIAMGAHPRVLADATGDGGAITGAAAALKPDNGTADLAGALDIATAAMRGASDVSIVVVGDGVLGAESVRSVYPFPVTFLRVGTSGDNVAVDLLQPSRDGRSATVSVSSWSDAPRSVRVQLQADATLVDVKDTTIPAHQRRDLLFTLPAGVRRLHASVATGDTLAVDDSADSVMPSGGRLGILLVTKRNIFLERALGLRGDVTVTTVTPDAYSATTDRADLDVFDGWAPASLPSRPYLLVDPPQGTAGSGGSVVPHQLEPHTIADPLLADVDLTGVHVAQAHDLHASTAGRPVIDSDAGPLLLAQDEPRTAVLGFDIHDSDLPVRAAFPVLIQHLSEFLLPQLTDTGRHVLDSTVRIPAVAGATTVHVDTPDGSSADLAVSGAGAVMTRTDAPGVYSVTEKSGGRTLTGAFAVSGTALTSVAPRDPPPVSSVDVTATESTRYVDRWSWLIVLLIVVLCAEWWVFHRA
jgi:Ca-activated chloride channel family protein